MKSLKNWSTSAPFVVETLWFMGRVLCWAPRDAIRIDLMPSQELRVPRPKRSIFCVFMMLSTLFGVATYTAACTNSAHTKRGEAARTALLQLVVSPDQAEVYIDEQYYGEVARWRDGVIALTPGDHQVELRASGHLTERFDVRMYDGGELVLDVVMEPELSVPSLHEEADAPQPPSPTFPLSRKP